MERVSLKNQLRKRVPMSSPLRSLPSLPIPLTTLLISALKTIHYAIGSCKGAVYHVWRPFISK